MGNQSNFELQSNETSATNIIIDEEIKKGLK
jgi:hypothetical protein